MADRTGWKKVPANREGWKKVAVEAVQPEVEAAEPGFLEQFTESNPKQAGLFASKEEQGNRPLLDPHGPIGYAKSGVMGAAQGATLSFAEELQALKDTPGKYMDQLGEQLSNKLGVSDKKAEDLSPAEIYRKLRDGNRAEYKAAEAEHPNVYLGGELVGGFAIPGGAVVKGATRGAKVIQAIKTGAKVGGGYGLGKSDADLTKGEVVKAAKDTALSAGIGAVGSGVLTGAAQVGGAAAKRIADFTRQFSGNQAVKAAGLDGGRINNLVHKLGLEVDELPELGNRMMDEKLIPVLGNKAKTAKLSEEMMSKEGQKIGDILERANTDLPAGPDFDSAASRAWGHLMTGPNGRRITTAAEEAAGPAKKLVENISKESGDFNQLNQLKSDAYKFANFDPVAKMQPKLFRKTVKGLKESVEDQVGDASGAEAKEALKTANDRYGLAAMTKGLSKDTAGREATHKQFGWGNFMLGTAGAGVFGALGGSDSAGKGIAGGAAGAVILPVLGALISRRGHAPVALATRAMSRAMASGGPVLEQMFGKTGSLLAAQKSPELRQKLLEELSSDPVHQAEIVKGLEAEADKAEPSRLDKFHKQFGQ